MNKLTWMLHWTFLLTVGLTSYNSFAAPVGDCIGTPSEAIIDLPSPLNVWGEIVCTRYGHILSNKEGWIWSYPGAYSPVFVPSQMVRNNPAELGNKSYFTSIQMTNVVGVEFEEAYASFHSGMAKDEHIPVGYRLDVTSVSGENLKLYFFDYGDFSWGIWCRDACDPKSSFMVMNISKQPKHN